MHANILIKTSNMQIKFERISYYFISRAWEVMVGKICIKLHHLKYANTCSKIQIIKLLII